MNAVQVIEYVISANGCVGEVPKGKAVKTYTGKNALIKAQAMRDKLNDKEAAKEPIEGEPMIGYYVKGEVAAVGPRP